MFSLEQTPRSTMSVSSPSGISVPRQSMEIIVSERNILPNFCSPAIERAGVILFLSAIIDNRRLSSVGISQ